MKFKKTYINYKGRDTYDSRTVSKNSGKGVYLSSSAGSGGSGGGSTTTSSMEVATKASLSAAAYAQGEETPNNAVNAYSLTAFETKKADTAGHWNADIWYVKNYTDGLTIVIRNITDCYKNGEGYNTLNINGLGAKLIWKDLNTPLGTDLKKNSEIMLVYREVVGSFTIPSPNYGELESETVPTSNTIMSGWVIVSGAGGAASGSGSATGGGGGGVTTGQVQTMIESALTPYATSAQTQQMITTATQDFCKVSVLTLEQYQALTVKDLHTFYIIHNNTQ